MLEFNNCNELIEGLITIHNDACVGRANVIFQGDECEILGGHPSSENIKHGIFIVENKLSQYVFLVGPEHGGLFSVFLYKSPFRLDETLCIDIPSYVREEFIFTLTGNW